MENTSLPGNTLKVLFKSFPETIYCRMKWDSIAKEIPHYCNSEFLTFANRPLQAPTNIIFSFIIGWYAVKRACYITLLRKDCQRYLFTVYFVQELP